MKGEPIGASIVFGVVAGVSAGMVVEWCRHGEKEMPEPRPKTFAERFGVNFKEKEIER